MKKPNKMRFAFIIPNLDFGGAEKICATYMNELSQLGHSCQVFLSEESIQYPLSPLVSKCVVSSPINKKGFKKLIFLSRYYSRLAQEIQKFSPDILVSSLHLANLQTLIALKLIPVRKRPFCLIRLEGIFTEPPGFLSRKLYPTADRIIAVSDGLRNHLIRELNISPGKAFTLCNPFNLNEIEANSREEVSHSWFASTIPIIISVGRLEAQKNQGLLIRAFGKVIQKKQARLVLIGQGPLKLELENLTTRLGLTDSVCFLNFESNPYRYMSKAKVFVLPSRSEGFGNVLVEAICCGTPVISTNCDFGPNEIIKDGYSGHLVPPENEAALADKILTVLNQNSSSSMIDNAKKAIQRFNTPNVMQEFFSLLPEGKKSLPD